MESSRKGVEHQNDVMKQWWGTLTWYQAERMENIDTVSGRKGGEH